MEHENSNCYVWEGIGQEDIAQALLDFAFGFDLSII